MKSIVGLVEYTVTGGFLWIACFALALFMGDNLNPLQIWSKWLDHVATHIPLGKQPEFLKDGLSIIFAGIVLISVFATGLVLELLAPIICGAFEIRWIRKSLIERREPWFEALVNQHGDLLGADYAKLTNSNMARWKPAFLLSDAYRTLSVFVSTYALMGAKNGLPEQMFERLKIWRVARAISVAMLFLALALIFAGPHGLDPWRTLLFRAVVPGLLLLAAWHMTRTSFLDLVQYLRTTCFLAWIESRRGTANAAVPRLIAQRRAPRF